MATQLTTVCDFGGEPAVGFITFKDDGKSYQLDVCARHLSDLKSKAHPAKRGRPRKNGAVPAKSPRKRKTTAKKTAARKRKA